MALNLFTEKNCEIQFGVNIKQFLPIFQKDEVIRWEERRMFMCV